MLDGVTVHHLSPSDAACALSHLSAEALCAHSLTLPAAQALGTSPGGLWVWAGRQLGWCVSPGTLPERVLVVLCGQKKHSSAAKLISHYGPVSSFCTDTSWGERGTGTGRGSLYASCSSSLSPGECWGQQPEALEVSQIILKTVAANIYSLNLLDFEPVN